MSFRVGAKSNVRLKRTSRASEIALAVPLKAPMDLAGKAFGQYVSYEALDACHARRMNTRQSDGTVRECFNIFIMKSSTWSRDMSLEVQRIIIMFTVPWNVPGEVEICSTIKERG